MTVWCIPAEGTHILSQIHRRRNQISGVSFYFFLRKFKVWENWVRENWTSKIFYFIIHCSYIVVSWDLIYESFCLDSGEMCVGFGRKAFYHWSEMGKNVDHAHCRIFTCNCWGFLVVVNVYNWPRNNNAPLN